MTAMWSIGIDVGGTYVDVVAIDRGGQRLRQKIPRIAADPAASVLAALDAALAAMAIAPSSVARVAHGSTLVTNMLLEQKAAPITVITNRGFTDLLLIGRQNRRDLYAPVTLPQTPKALFPDAMRFGIAGRCDASGREIEPLDPAELTRLADDIACSGTEAVAICLLHSIHNPAHELAVAQALKAHKSELAVSLSHQVDVAAGEFERFLATALDAYVKQPTHQYLAAFTSGLQVRGLPEPVIVGSDAGLHPVSEVATAPLSLALAGPAAAMSGFLLYGANEGACISLETGGTTTDIGLIEQGEILCGRKIEIGELPISLRATDILSVAIGGGSIVQINRAGALRLGPHSAGSVPGPAAYGRGGQLPTLTDALVVLQRLPDSLAGSLTLDTAAAHRVIQDVATALGCDVTTAANAVVAVATVAIAEGVKAHAYRHGIDPSTARLIAGGGGGAQHAAEVAELLGCAQVLVPADAGVVSALGCLAAPEVAAAERALDLPLDDQHWPALLQEAGRISGPSAIAWSLEAVYQGQSAPLEISFHPDCDSAETLARRFDQMHERVRGHAFRRSVRALRLRGQWVTQPAVLRDAIRLPAIDAAAQAGPMAVFTETTSLWIPPGWECRRDSSGGFVMQRIESSMHVLRGAA